MDCRVAALLAVTGVARLQVVAKCRHCEAVGRGNPCIHRLPGQSTRGIRCAFVARLVEPGRMLYGLLR